ncbi:hypothetical protein BC351_20775 [Paenibacillus ferrarius]|uniref:Uncharacterized protein n=1 Tax=Paenibacillus ferrarius TaxID=1469647 RepID=A0A1V4HND4_9BACL|nr:hypothetical protein [Paenibacillus ferrarius]OPH59346.1 hypothetical protein BC351_20775 [Paenibacillus ferrarius]
MEGDGKTRNSVCCRGALVIVTEGCTSKLVKEGADTTAALATTASNISILAPMSAASPAEPPTKSPVSAYKPASAIEMPRVPPSPTASASYGYRA